MISRASWRSVRGDQPTNGGSVPHVMDTNPAVSVTCPHCGGAIYVQIRVQSGTQSGANTSANGQIAQAFDLKAFEDLNPSPKRQRRYNQGYDQEFLRFWEVYPIHRNKRQAYKAWDSALRRMLAKPGAKISASQGAILAGAIRYRDDPNRVDEFTQHAATWLNGDGWEDDPLPFRLRPGDPEAEERARLKEKKLADARHFVEEERRVR